MLAPPPCACPPLPLLQYEAGSAPALALQATIEKTERRFDNYAKQGLLCGNEGLPHLIADPGLALRYGHAGDVLVSPTARLLACCQQAAQPACPPVCLRAVGSWHAFLSQPSSAAPQPPRASLFG
jgi:hypothetical protein